MRVEVNGEQRDVPDDATIGRLLEELGLADALVAVERNEEVVPRADHGATRLAAGDRVEVVQFVGGG